MAGALLPQALESSLIALGLASGIVAIAVLLRWYCLVYHSYRTPQARGRQKLKPPRHDTAKPTPFDWGFDGGIVAPQPPPTVSPADLEAAATDVPPPAPLTALEESPPSPRRTRITVVTTPPTAETTNDDDDEQLGPDPSPAESGVVERRNAPRRKRPTPKDRKRREAVPNASPGPGGALTLGGSTATGGGTTSTTAADAKMLAQWKQRAARSFNVAAGGGRPREEFDDEIDDATTDDDGTSRLGIVPYGGGRGRIHRRHRRHQRKRHQRRPSAGSRSSDPDGFGTDGFGTDGEDGAGSGGSAAWSIHRRWLGWTASPASEAAIRPPRGSVGGEDGMGRGRWNGSGGGGGTLSFDSSAGAASGSSGGATTNNPDGGVYGCRRLGIVPLWTTGCGGHPSSLQAVAAALDPPPPPPPPPLFPLPEWTESGARPQE